MIIYSNGCSHTSGHCVRNNYTWPNIVIRSLIENKNYEINPFKNKLNSKSNILFNESISGAGNDFIFHKSLESICELLQNNIKPDYVLIQWSGPNRRMYCHPNGRTVFVNLYDNVEYGIKFEPMASEHTLHYIFSMQEFLKRNEINYCFFNYMSLDQSIKKLKVFNQIDMSKFANFELNENILLTGLLDYLKKNDLACDEQGHPNDKGNFLMAHEVCKIIGTDIIDEDKFYDNTSKLI
jgi:hypothetical protein